MSDTVTTEKPTLANYDIAVLIDISGSMSSQLGDSTRFKVAQETTEAIARKCDTIDEDGITVGFFNDKVKLQKNVTADAVSRIFDEVEPMGGTNTAQALKDVLATKGTKPLLTLIITDGEPQDRQAVVDVLVNAANGIERDEELAFQFLQIGDDAGATAFLQHLDDNLTAKFDIVDTTKLADVADLGGVVALLEKTIND